MTKTLTTEQLQDIYEAAVHAESVGDDQDAGFELLCKLEDVGGTGATIRKLIDMVRAANREAQPAGFYTTVSGRKGVVWHNGAPEDDTAIYTAPPAPAVPRVTEIPEAATLTNINQLCPLDNNLSQTDFATGWNDCRQYAITNDRVPPVAQGWHSTAQGWNACRAAMLAQPVSQGCKLADSSGGWIEHDGDSIPKTLDRNALVYLKTRGKELKFPYPAGIVRWGHFNNDFDIVAYKMAAAPEGGND
ncbi:MAG: hypothetical protein ACTINL_03815 [Serratia proteamaculans]